MKRERESANEMDTYQFYHWTVSSAHMSHKKEKNREYAHVDSDGVQQQVRYCTIAELRRIKVYSTTESGKHTRPEYTNTNNTSTQTIGRNQQQFQRYHSTDDGWLSISKVTMGQDDRPAMAKE